MRLHDGLLVLLGRHDDLVPILALVLGHDGLLSFFPPEATWTHPAGGMFLWITLPDYMDTDSMLAEALEAGGTYVPGSARTPR